MVAAIITGGFIILILSWLLFAPLTLQIDTEQDEYVVRWFGIGSARILPVEDEVIVRFKVFFFFWKKEINPLKYLLESKKKKEKEKKVKTKKRGFKMGFLRIRKLFLTFRVHYFRLDVDTDDYVQNAFLFPVFYFLKCKKARVVVNFQGRNECRLKIDNQVARMVWALIF